MRKLLDALYGAALAGACLSMVMIVTLVFLQVLARVIDRVIVFFGMPRYGFIIPSLSEIGGFLLVAATFLALPATLRAAGHVRVTLLQRYFRPAIDKAMTGVVLLIALGLASFAAWAIWLQTAASFQRGSLSYGIMAIPLWIPQGVMTVGIVIFVIALLDELITLLLGGEPSFRQNELNREVTEGGH